MNLCQPRGPVRTPGTAAFTHSEPLFLLPRCQMMLIVFVLLAADTGSSASVVEIHKEVGGTATFTCPSDGRGDPEFVYLQKEVGKPSDMIFVNGFHAQKPVEMPAIYKNRSHVDSNSRQVILWDLSPADEGLYVCVVRIKIDSHTSHTSEIKYNLTITANYSQPQLMEIHNGSTCNVTCSSNGGYPQSEMEMVLVPNVPGATVTKQIMEDPVTGLFSVSSTITLNVSQPLSVTCIVGNLSSVLNVHQIIDPPQPDSIIIIVACVLVSVLFIVALAVVLQRRRCSRNGSLDVIYSAAQRK
nr:T-lymphocyte activation antigen CD86-like isoform X2 [Paramormyrops kingsleyae]